MMDYESNESDSGARLAGERNSAVSLHIERLVIEGIQLGPGQAAQVQVALEREMARLIAANGLSARLIASGSLLSIGASGIKLSSAVNAQRLGGQIARAVYSGFEL